jgi:hypothetical protein
MPSLEVACKLVEVRREDLGEDLGDKQYGFVARG